MACFPVLVNALAPNGLASRLTTAELRSAGMPVTEPLRVAVAAVAEAPYRTRVLPLTWTKAEAVPIVMSGPARAPPPARAVPAPARLSPPAVVMMTASRQNLALRIGALLLTVWSPGTQPGRGYSHCQHGAAPLSRASANSHGSALAEASPARADPHHRSERLHVVVKLELMRVGPQADRGELVLALVGNPRFDQVRGEHAALEQEVMICLEVVEHLVQ